MLEIEISLAGTMHEKSDLYAMIEKILEHPTNIGRDPHTRALIRIALSQKTLEELDAIEKRLEEGENLCDNF